MSYSSLFYKFLLFWIVVSSVVQPLKASRDSDNEEDVYNPPSAATISLDLSMYNRDEKFYLTVRVDDGTQVCADTFSRDERTKCKYDVSVLKHGWNNFHVTIYSLDQQEIVYQKVEKFHYDAKQSIIRTAGPTRKRLSAGAVATFFRENRGLIWKSAALILLVHASGKVWMRLALILSRYWGNMWTKKNASSTPSKLTPPPPSPPPSPPPPPPVTRDEDQSTELEGTITSLSIASVETNGKLINERYRHLPRYAMLFLGLLLFRYSLSRLWARDDTAVFDSEPIGTSLASSQIVEEIADLTLPPPPPPQSPPPPLSLPQSSQPLGPSTLNLIVIGLSQKAKGVSLAFSRKVNSFMGVVAPTLRPVALRILKMEIAVLNYVSDILSVLQRLEERGITVLVYSTLRVMETAHYVVSQTWYACGSLLTRRGTRRDV